MDVSFLGRELRSAEHSLAVLEEKERQQQRAVDGYANRQESEDSFGDASLSTVFERLLALQTTTDSLALAQDYLAFLESTPEILRADNNNNNNNNNDDLEALLARARLCDELAHRVLLKHADNLLDTCPTLYREAYLPLFDYLHEYLVTLLRQELQSSRYPSARGCGELLGRKNGAAYLAIVCQHLTRLEDTHEKVVQAVEGINLSASDDHGSVLLELFHPLLDRVYFHFINTNPGDGDAGNGPRMTATRIDRLPEWLLNYIKNNFLQDNGPYQLVLSVMGPGSVLPFCRELVRLIQWVLVENRNFFDDPAISGPKSNPQILYQAMEQFLEFDTVLMELLADTANATNHAMVDANTTNSAPSQFSGLMDVLVASNDDLFGWWVQRERESVSSTLFADDDSDHKSSPKAPLASHVSPRAELFCALIRSVQLKASTLTDPGVYLREVAVPLCTQFVDALRETSVDLRNRLTQKHNRQQQQPFYAGAIDSEKQLLVSNINEWIEIVNGTQLASQILLSNERAVSSQSDHDLGRFGRSLERLVEVMMDEFALAFVETTLMEHAKFANYLMLASHLLASPEHPGDDTMGKDSLTAELGDTKLVLQYFQEICDSILRPRSLPDEDPADDEENLASVAPLGMRVRVADRVVDKLLDVALDTSRVTPDIWLEGASVFARDVQILLGSYADVSAVFGLLEVTKFMTMDYDDFCGLFAAVGGLTGSDSYLDIEELNNDTTLRDEAISMLKVKKVNCPLDYALSIMNRRRS